jgi:SAM-dependent methyltransferase
VLDRLGATHGRKKVLEAGCGSLTHVRFVDPYVVGVDISREQLARNSGLAEAICADLQTWEPRADEFDVVVCWDVLEHLPEPRLALANLVRAARPGGLLILALPNVLSLKGLLAKLTPHGFHVWAYRHFWGVARAGTEGRGPFRTYLRLATAPGAMLRFARAANLQVEHFSAYESLMQRRFRKDHPLGNLLFAASGRVGRLLTGGRFDPTLSDYILVLRKPAP